LVEEEEKRKRGEERAASEICVGIKVGLWPLARLPDLVRAANETDLIVD
jgi:hypothetical protein